MTLSVKLLKASCPLVSVPWQVYVPPSLVKVVLIAKMYAFIVELPTIVPVLYVPDLCMVTIIIL